MAGDLDLRVAQAVSRAHLLETALHHRGPWDAVLYGTETECRLPVTRDILWSENRVSFVIYALRLPWGIETIELYCNRSPVVVRPVEAMLSGPCRIIIDVGVGEPETVS